jgi:hypothetical protein
MVKKMSSWHRISISLVIVIFNIILNYIGCLKFYQLYIFIIYFLLVGSDLLLIYGSSFYIKYVNLNFYSYKYNFLIQIYKNKIFYIFLSLSLIFN